MTETPVTLADLLRPAERMKITGKVQSAITGTVPAVRLTGIDMDGAALGESLATSVDKAMSVSPVTMILDAFKALNEVRERTDPAAPPDAKAHTVALQECTVTAEHEPSIWFLIDGAKIHEVAFKVKLSLTVAAGVITILQRQVESIRLGTVTSSIEVKVAGEQVLKRSLGTIPLPEVNALGPA